MCELFALSGKADECWGLQDLATELLAHLLILYISQSIHELSDLDSLLYYFKHSWALFREDEVSARIWRVSVGDFDGLKAKEDDDHTTIINKCLVFDYGDMTVMAVMMVFVDMI